ncbi:MAG: type II secretion system F family protein [Kiritimatiellia bacterium]|jgi:type II secretory pathway component PulF
MPTFVYTARNAAGEKISGNIDAPDRRTALLHIERQGALPVQVEEKTAEALRKATQPRRGLHWRRDQRPRMSSREMLTFTTELSDLLASGMKLGNALNTLSQRRSRGECDTIIRGLRDDIVQGSSLSEALEKYPESFPQLYSSLIRAGEAGGALPEVMQRIVTYYERIQEVRGKIYMALVYPGIVMLTGITAMIFTMVFVIPRFSLIFEDLGSTLPLPTRILIGISSAMISYGWLMIIILIVAAVIVRRYLRTPSGRLWWHTTQMKIPLVREMVMAGAFTRFAQTLGMLIGNGVSVLEALRISERTIQNAVLAQEIKNARERVTDGATISGPLAAGKVFPPMLTDMLAIGEETGDMAGALAHIARRYENMLDRSVKIFTTLLEPILIVIMASLVGFVAISILLAVFDVTSGLNV